MTWKARLLISLTFSLIVGALCVESIRRNVQESPYVQYALAKHRLSYADLFALHEFPLMIKYMACPMIICFLLGIVSTRKVVKLDWAIVAVFAVVGGFSAVTAGVIAAIHIYPEH